MCKSYLPNEYIAIITTGDDHGVIEGRPCGIQDRCSVAMMSSQIGDTEIASIDLPSCKRDNIWQFIREIVRR